MILKKPYAFFIKMFKPIHLVLAILVGYLIYLENIILNFLNNYIYTSTNVVGQNIKDVLVNNGLYIVPVIIIVSSIIILSIMLKKEKPILFYLISIFSFIVVFVINLYAINFLGILETTIVAIKNAKFIHDLIFINMIIESVSIIFLAIRGMGLNIKKFNFDSDISKIDISQSDREEFELELNVDLDESRRKRRRKLRYLKYAYVEKKFLINSIAIISIFIISLIVFVIVITSLKENKEGVIYSLNTFSFSVDNTYIVTEDYNGEKITDNYLVVVDTKMKSNFEDNEVYLKDFSLNIEGTIFKATTKYSNSLTDLGNYYNGSNMTLEYSNYLFVYEIPEKYINSEMTFSYYNKENNIEILLNPKNIITGDKTISKNISEEIIFEGLFEGLKFKINGYELSDKFILEYNYCVKTNDCVLSKEYLKGSMNENFDKYVLKLNVEYNNDSKINLSNFYNLFDKFGEIQYKIGDKWYSQTSNFEEIKSSKKKEKNIVYIGVNQEIKSASNIKLVFNIRGVVYEYILK